MDERIQRLISQLKAHLIKMKMALNGCGCVERKLVPPTNSGQALSEVKGTIDDSCYVAKLLRRVANE